jgi:asparagine synthase (glutamine-hydrolysing)
MCGIAGHAGPTPVPPERVERCLEAMRHRGPDDASARSFVTPAGRRVDLLHRRLTIIDFDPRSNQPFRHGSLWVTTNGELYNYLELRAALERRGVAFRTASDTEVLAADLAARGAAALDDWEGMFAFAAYDEETGELVLCRDRFGEKPLYLLRDGDDLYWGSEVKLLAALSGKRLEPNLDHLRRYLVNGYKALYKTRETFFHGVEELPSGTLLALAPEGRETRRRYWEPGPPAVREQSYEEAVASAREAVIRSVELRLRADTPLAFCLSGGVDSQTLVAVAKRVFGYDVHGFTIVNTDERYEEWDLVERSVRELGLRHEAIPIRTEGFLPSLRALVRHHDAPLATITYYAHWLLMRAIHEHGYRISVSGTGADELFTGYFDHHLLYLAAVRGDEELHARSLAAWREHIAPIVRNPYLSNPDLFVDDPDERRHIYLGHEEWEAALVTPWHEDFREERYAELPLRNRMLNELFHESVPVILHEDDLNAMSFSIENRSPFLDRRLFETAYAIPARHLVRDGAAKAVLRDAMRGIVPDAVLDSRRKVGFNAPVLDFLDVDDPAVRAELLAPSPVWELVRREKVEELLDRDFLPNSASKFLFNVVNAKLFLEELG